MSEPEDQVSAPPVATARWVAWFREHPGPIVVTLLLLTAHTAIIWLAMGGWAGLTNDWPILLSDFGLHYPHGIASREFLRQSGFTAGYDPSFMAGFPMSAVSGTSSTWSNLAIFLFGGRHPAVAFKVSIFLSVIAAPILMGGASALLGARPVGIAWSVILYLTYFWTDFPGQYIFFGMVSFFLAIPLALVALATLVRYLEEGTLGAWCWAALACSVLFLVHVTSPLVVGPAALLAYGKASFRRDREPAAKGQRWRWHVGFWGLGIVVLAVNAFWWLPAFWLRSTVGATEFAFAHSESVLKRLGEIFTKEAPIEVYLIGLGIVGLLIWSAIRPIATTALAGMVAAGFAWGYLAGWSRALDGLQPGRQTYACYAGLCVAGGLALSEIGAWIRAARRGRLDRWIILGFVLVGIRVFGASIVANVEVWAFEGEPLLSSRPLTILVNLIGNIKQHLQPGDRLLYEESGLALPGEDDPFLGHHLSPILPTATGVEILGGPYLHTPVQTNFTQFGEGRLFGDRNWGRAQFVRYARLYRPVAIACWSRKARAFCQQNPDLIQLLADDGKIFLGRVVGFEGATIRGQARVEAGPNRLVVHDAVAGADGLVVLRYHATPCLVAEPATPIEPVYLEADPVPFIGLRINQPGPITIRLVLPPPGGWLQAPRLPPRR